LFRVNSKGAFNVPAGDYKNPKICDGQNLVEVSKVLQKAEIKNASFEQVVEDYKPYGFVYFDPPYRPISKTAGFTSYSTYNFNDKDQAQLAKVFRKLHQKGAKVMLSNSDPKNIDPQDHFFDDLYSEFQIKRIPAKRAINSNPAKRGAINEIVVMNYTD
jgi:DNA adenine methylase